jgi:hypothetical protein
MTDKLVINKFDPTEMVKYANILIIGKRDYGRENLIQEIVQNNNAVKGLLFSPQDKEEPYLSKINIFSENTYFEHNSNAIAELIDNAYYLIEGKKYNKDINTEQMIVFNDMRFKNICHDENVTEILFNGRHYNMCCIYCSEIPPPFTPKIRCNFDYIFIFSEDSHAVLNKLYQHYAGMFPTFNSFKEIFNEATRNGGCMVIVNRGTSLSFLDKVLWYKPEVDEIIEEIIYILEDSLTVEEEILLLDKTYYI